MPKIQTVAKHASALPRVSLSPCRFPPDYRFQQLTYPYAAPDDAPKPR